jgi:adenosyl cobinamide kinase/adenosyl cobinamide phosphate guanylyltransferase
VFTGGARSGKSRAAQALALERHARGHRVVVAVFGRESDTEMTARIARHRDDRPEGFDTLAVEHSADWLARVPEGDLLVVDCLGTFVGLVMEECWTLEGGSPLDPAEECVAPEVAEAVSAAVASTVDALVRRAGDTIVVTNEVGDGVVPAYAAGRLFRDVLGAANRTLVDAADRSHLCVAGRLLDLHRLDRAASWPED